MGRELVNDSLDADGGMSDSSAPISYAENFYKQLPYYLAIGMSWDEFWEDDCTKTKYYRQAYELKKKQKNLELWLQGLYIYEAIGDLAPILRFSLSKHPQKPLAYPLEPYPLDEVELEAHKQKKEQEDAKRAKEKMMRWMTTVNKAKASKCEGGGIE